LADAAAVMQAIESQTLILYHTDLRGEWPGPLARAFARGLPYLKRLAAARDDASSRASLAGVALAVRALTHLLARPVSVGELVFGQGRKPQLAERSALASVDFSISHSGPYVVCAAVRTARVGLDIEFGTDARKRLWVAQEATLKAAGEGLRALSEGAPSVAASHVEWRGVRWQLTRLNLFADALGCIVSSRAVRVIRSQSVHATELFAA
jgi:4'-phosphopantetheinyl transferase EntD